MVKWIVVIIAILGTSWVFKGTIKKIIWKFKHKKHNVIDPNFCWYCKEQKRKERERKELEEGGD